jgi:hypothetical protein
MAWLILVLLDLVWIAVLLGSIDDRRSQARFGLGHVRLDEMSFTLGGRLTLHVGNERGLAGLRGVTAWLQCVDAVMEMRGEGQAAERERICYVVWEELQSVEAKDLPARGEVSFQFTLPVAGDFAGPVGDHLERYWHVEVLRGGAAPLRFRVLVYPPSGGEEPGAAPGSGGRTSGTMT